MNDAPLGTHTCHAPKDKTLKGIGGERCGAPATVILPTGWYCEACTLEIRKAIEGGGTLLNILRDFLKKPLPPKS